MDGYIQYRYENTTFRLIDVRVDDGRWHNIQVKWMHREIWLNLDYGDFEKTIRVDEHVAGLYIGKVTVGGVEPSDPSNVIGFTGCIKVRFFKNCFYRMKWRPPSLSELTPIVFNMGFTHLGSEASKYET